ncbi:MAG: DUF481 domain-containing protein [Candidatus Aminicenantes bacterium]|uniref:DUF481 domain-containing protein n=1 Tax=Candidatus Saccharicenans subterraneus TaxID=2508984 RepID=A0A3E2BKS9_9BACT|nr:DUF481 domain-containing protein [Candidatus Aminicenantes bacterium]RFT15294.1 MAG: hypothetical protein OP8BY_0403 [Candidatus Saccharicenans subterraneum]
MKTFRKFSRVGLSCLAISIFLGMLASLPAAAEETKEKAGLLGPWKATAELSYVVTGGNTATSAFSLGTNLTRKWTRDSLTFKSFILRSTATTYDRWAVGTETDYYVVEETTKNLVAENYLLSGAYERKFSSKLLGQLGASWDRNKFAGVDRRYMVIAGLGYAWIEKERTNVKMNAGLTYSSRKYIGQEATSFAGFRFDLLGEQKFSDKSSFSTLFVFDENLKEMKDWRFDWTNSLTASISRAMALKASYKMLYANLPATAFLPLFDDLGLPTGLTVPYSLKKLDSFFTTSLVINF